jgi:hypothetical protein
MIASKRSARATQETGSRRRLIHKQRLQGSRIRLEPRNFSVFDLHKHRVHRHGNGSAISQT